MRLAIAVGIVLGLVVMFAGCSSKSLVPQSTITIYRVSPEVPISSARERGAITLHAGEDYQILVKRLTNDDSGTQTSEVTAVCVYRFSQNGFATANTLGVIHGVAPGFTTLEVKFTPGALDPVDRCYLDITIEP
jgi:hypothetical protein